MGIEIDRLAARRAGVNAAAVLKLVLAVDDDGIARTQTFADGDGVARVERHGHRLNLDAAILLSQVNVGPLWAARDSRSRNDGDVALRIDQQVNVHELVGK